jgi:hypothetical protein
MRVSDRHSRGFHLRGLRSLGFVLAVTLSTACTKQPPNKANATGQRAPAVDVAGGETSPVSPQAQTPNVSKTTPFTPPGGPARAALAADDRNFGAPTTFGNLGIYPVTSRSQVDVGPLVSLDDALAKKEADVRENQGGGTVNELVIENKSTTPIFVLAGTVVRGGKQDRQIGQDFIIEGKKTTAVDAFCVEHGRWTGQRNGQVTNGHFDSSAGLATSKVRAAGQYKKSQSEVWSNVSSTNAAHEKHSSSDTLTATMDDTAIATERAQLVAHIDKVLDAVSPQDDLVGVAYALDGEVQGARWFLHHKIFEMNRKKIVAGIALDAITARAVAKRENRPASTKPTPAPAAVETFVKNVEAQAVAEQRDTPAANVNEYKESSQAYGSKTMMKSAPAKVGSKAVSSDYLKK